jgi:hypothetical protein
MKATLLTLLMTLCLAIPAQAQATDPMEGRLALTVQRHSTCGTDDWGWPCGWINSDQFAPVVFEGWSDPVGPVYQAGTDNVLPSMDKVMVPAYTYQGGWREAENQGGRDPDWGAVFINNSGDGPNYCETWGTQPNWNQGRNEAWWGGCMDYNTNGPLKAFPQPNGVHLGVQASGLPFIGTILTAKEWKAWQDHGAVPNHPLGVVVPYSCSTWRKPANRTDGASWWRHWWENDECIELGTIYKLAADYNPGYQVWSSFTRLMIEMAKKGGLIPTDQTGGCCLVVRTENWQRYYAPWTNYDWQPQDPYGFNWDDRQMRQFPWAALKVE